MRKKPTWEDAVERYKRERREGPSTKQDDMRFAKLDAYFAGRPLEAIDSELIAGVISDWQRDLSPSTINRDLVPLKALLRRAYRIWKWIPSVPYVERLKEPEGRTRWLKPEEVSALLAHCPPHQQLMIRFAVSMGLRPANVVRLRWDQVDLAAGIVTIEGKHAKSRKTLVLPINAVAMSVLEEVKGQHPDYVFTYRTRKRAIRRKMRSWGYRSFREAAARAGLKDVSPYVFRHTFATWHARNGTRELELAKLMGHSSTRMVQRYAKIADDHLKRASCNILADLEKMSGAGNEARTRDLNLGKGPKTDAPSEG